MATRHSVRHYAEKEVSEDVICVPPLPQQAEHLRANQQPWHFVAISDAAMKTRIREAAEIEEQAFMMVAAVMNGWPHWSRSARGRRKASLRAPWLIVVFAQRYGIKPDGSRYKHYYVPESVGITKRGCWWRRCITWD